ncbi:MAG: hypothetical protein BAJALOKI1v1_990001 [Promethearchaeota archaeon]|nr:MAG: hypothetical protein BAJALOKI1v1_990001 [Candidatus Lokiarchaeota archaeon]
MFSITKAYHILHFNYNLTLNGWNLDVRHFKSFAKKVIYKQNYDLQVPSIREFDLDHISDRYYGPNTSEYKNLKNLYSYQPEDLKRFLARKAHHKMKSFQNLFSKDLVFPYLKLKNLGFKEVFHFIIPNISKQTINSLIKVFGFFNYCFLFEIEGEFFIQNSEDIKFFEKGLYIKLHLPDCEFSEFYNVFHEIFSLLGIIEASPP